MQQVNRSIDAPNGESFCWFHDSGAECTVANIYCHNCNDMDTTEVIGVGSKYFDETDCWYPEWKFYYGNRFISERQNANWKHQEDLFGSRRAAAMNAIDHVVKIICDLEEIPLFCYHFVEWVRKNYPELSVPRISGNDYKIIDDRREKADQGELQLK